MTCLGGEEEGSSSVASRIFELFPARADDILRGVFPEPPKPESRRET
jgi:hypothetical protein